MNTPNPNMVILVETEYCIECVDANLPKIEAYLNNIPTMGDGQNADIKATASIHRSYKYAYRSFPWLWKKHVTYDIWFRVSTCHPTQNDMIADACSSLDPYSISNVPEYVGNGHNQAFESIKNSIASLIPNILKVSRGYVRHSVAATQSELKKYHDALTLHAQTEMQKLDYRYNSLRFQKKQYEQDFETSGGLKTLSFINSINAEMDDLMKEYQDLQKRSSNIRLLDMNVSSIIKGES